MPYHTFFDDTGREFTVEVADNVSTAEIVHIEQFCCDCAKAKMDGADVTMWTPPSGFIGLVESEHVVDTVEHDNSGEPVD